MYLAALQRGYIIQREKEKKKTSYLQGLRLKSPYKRHRSESSQAWPLYHCQATTDMALTVAKSSNWKVTIEDFVVVSIASNIPFELLAECFFPTWLLR